MSILMDISENLQKGKAKVVKTLVQQAIEEGIAAKEILSEILFEFPVKEINVSYPRWINNLPLEHPVRAALIESIKTCAQRVEHIRDISRFDEGFKNGESVESVNVTEINLGAGRAEICLSINSSLFAAGSIVLSALFGHFFFL